MQTQKAIFAFFQIDGENTFSEIFKALDFIQVGSFVIGVVALGILLLWNNVLSKKGKIFQIIQGPLVAVVAGIVFYVLTRSNETLAIAQSHWVSVPVPKDVDSFLGQFSFPNFEVIIRPDIWIVAFTIALVASLETLLCGRPLISWIRTRMSHLRTGSCWPKAQEILFPV